MILWTIDSMKKSLNDQKTNEKMTPYEKKNMLNQYYLILFQLKIAFFLYFM